MKADFFSILVCWKKLRLFEKKN